MDVATRPRGARTLLLLCAVVLVTRVTFLDAPLSSDEGGFLMVGSQWHAGTSLYGDYWVDRPPLLIALFVLADALGGATALRLLGCLAALAAVVLADQLGRGVRARGWSPWPAVAATAYVGMAMFGVNDVDGELLALPFVLGGLALAVQADRSATSRIRLAAWAGAGVLGAAAALVKQSFLDVFVFAAVLLLARAWADRDPGRLRWLLAVLTAGVLTTAAAVAGAASRGTSPHGLWDALVVFRLRAAQVIGVAASDATPQRLGWMLLVLAASGAAVVIGLLVVRVFRGPATPLVWATLALVGWELFGVLVGGSYWLHYLIGLIPGLVLTVALLETTSGRLRAATRTVTAYAVLAAVVSFAAWHLAAPPTAHTHRIGTWLAGRTEPGDTGVVLYGDPDILLTAGLTSPYEHLWSLPVRVRDPQLVELTAVLNGPDAPTWVLAWNDLNAWGISPDTARAVITSRYQLYAVVCDVDVYRLGRPPTAQPPEVVCPS